MTNRVPGAGAASIGALVALEGVDQHSSIVVVVERAGATRRRAWCRRGAVGLHGVGEGAAL
jgi:hypothetical protein